MRRLIEKIKLRIIIRLVSSLSDETREAFRDFLLDYLGFTVMTPEEFQQHLEGEEKNYDTSSYH